MKKTFVIDTNVLLHDPDAILKFPNNHVVVPVGVLEELGSMRKFSDERGKNARNVLRLFDTLKKDGQGDFHGGVSIKNGSKIRIQLETKSSMNGNNWMLSPSQDKIILAAFQLMEKGEKVVFVSKDLVSRVKAEAIGLEAEDYENMKYSFNNVYRGIRRIEVEKRVIDMFYKDGHVEVSKNVHGEPLEAFCANEYCVMTSPENSSAIGKYDTASGELVALIKAPDHIWGVKPLNVEQKCALDLLLRDNVKLVTLMGQAGTGKTLLALATGLRKVFDEGLYNKILVSRPIIPLGKDIGYLPGSKEEKLYHWMQPIYDNLEFLCGSSNSGKATETLRWVMDSQKIEMEAVTYIRGRTLPKIIMIIDEAQNLTPHEMKTIISRAGDSTKVILAGDPTQIDNPYLDKDSNGMTYAVGAFKDQKIFGQMFFDKTERSELAALAAEIL